MKQICILLIFAVSAFAERCETPCTREYRPVCGTDGKQFKIFANPCILKNQHCHDGHVWIQTRMGECPENVEHSSEQCERPCTRELRPTCGTDGKHFKVFPNKCVMGNEHCKNGATWIQTRMDDCRIKTDMEELLDYEMEDCEVPCTREYRPVCGTDGKHFKIFANPCLLKNEHCKDGNSWILSRMDQCSLNADYADDADEYKLCERPCTREYRPVCGTDGQHFKVFPNKCIMGNEHCHDGQQWIQTRMDSCTVQAENDDISNCETICTREYDPVCGTDGEHFKIFSNPCVMRNEHCRDGHKWIQTRMNKCGMQDDENDDEEDDESVRCRKMCPALFAPVCGFNGESYKLFPNKCLMGVDSCSKRKNWTKVSLEKCSA